MSYLVTSASGKAHYLAKAGSVDFMESLKSYFPRRSDWEAVRDEMLEHMSNELHEAFDYAYDKGYRDGQQAMRQSREE